MRAKRIRLDNGLVCDRLKGWHLFNNDYLLIEPIQVQTQIRGIEFDEELEDRGRVSMTKFGLFTLWPGFRWNGPSGPTVDTDNWLRGSGFHDGGYRAIRCGRIPLFYREYFDDLMYILILEDGMMKIRAKYSHYGVRRGGLDSALPGGGDI